MMNEFLQYLQYEKNFSSHTVLSYKTDLLQFLDFLRIAPGQFEPSSVSSQQLRQWVLTLMSANLSARTLSRKISTLRSFWRFLLKRGYASHNPTLKILLPKTNKSLPAFFKDNEMRAVLDRSFVPNRFETVRNQLIMTVFYLTGIRLSELINLKDLDVDLIEGNLRVVGKRNKQRVIPIDITLCKDIEAYIALRDSEIEAPGGLFVRADGRKMYPKMVYNLVNNTMSATSSLRKKSPHVLRHTFATAMLNGGADINAVKELLGHTSLAATQVYTHTSFEELYNIYNQAHPRAK